MQIMNFNDYVRSFIVKGLNVNDEFKDDELKRNAYVFYNKIINNKSLLEKIIEIMYLTSYMVTDEACKVYPTVESLKDEMEFLESVNTPKELLYIDDFDVFYGLCYDVVLFYFYDEESKKRIVKNMFEKTDKKLLRKFPLALNDFASYLKVNSIAEFASYYDDCVSELEDEKEAMKKAVSYTFNVLVKMRDSEPDKYQEMINSIISQYYTYNKYLLLNNERTTSDDAGYLVSLIESDYKKFITCSLSDRALLEKIIMGFLEYNTISFNGKRNIDRFFVEKSYGFSIKNVNTEVRKMLFKLFDDVGLDEDAYLMAKDRLDALKQSNLFDKVVRVLYVDYFAIAYDYLSFMPYNEDSIADYEFIKDFKSIDEFKSFLLESDYDLLIMIKNSILFNNMSLLDKKTLYLCMMKNDVYKDFVTDDYKYDLIESNRKYNVYDAYLLYDNNLLFEKNKESAIDVSSNELFEDLVDVSTIDMENYDDIIYDVCNIFYKYAKYKIENQNAGLMLVWLVNELEEGYASFSKKMSNDTDVESTVLQVFYEYLSLNYFEKMKVQSFYNELKKDGKVKILSKKNKNS